MTADRLKVRLAIQGMTCTACERHVEKALQGVGAYPLSVDFRRGEATFEVAEMAVIEEVKRSITASGYTPGNAEMLPVSHGGSHADGKSHDYDLAIIGSGGAAFSAAIQAVSHGARIVMIERGAIGGTCVNVGCVPSKTMLRAGEIHDLARQNPFAGLRTSAEPVDMKALVDQKKELVATLRQQKYVDLIDDYGFALIRGEARFIDEETVEVGGRRVTARRFLIATGATPVIPDIPGLRDVDYLTSAATLELQELPKRLAVIGSGYVAMELGQMFHHLGVEVTLMQRSARVLPSYDPEISEAVLQAFTQQGIRIVTGARFIRVLQDVNGKRIHMTVNDQEHIVAADQILVAAGRRPNTETLNLPAARVTTGDRGEIVVDSYLRTSNPRIYAAGDVTFGPQFVYVAAYEGRIAAENAVGGANQAVDLTAVPGVTFTKPAVATVGLTEEQARAQGYDAIASVLPLDAVPRALVNHETAGVCKLVADARTRKLLGAHMVAENAGEVIYAATLAVKFGLTIEDLRETMAPYLTMAEGLKLAALTFDKDVSRLSCCAG